MPFDKKKSKIAITMPYLKLLATADGLWSRYSEPYIVSLAVDEKTTANPSLSFNSMAFPKVREGRTVTMLGDGHLVYGPKNPGEFVAMSILIMESDSDIRNLGKNLEKIVKSKAVDLGIKAVIAASPGSAAVLGILKELTQFVSGAMQNNKDDELYRTDGVFLRDTDNPYHVNREYTQGNEWVEFALRVIPLDSPNGQGAKVSTIKL